MWREEAHSQRGSRELLSRPERTQRAGGDGSDGARAVVRALTGGAELRAVDWRSGGDSGQASAEAEERPSGCGTSIAVTGGGSISADLGTVRKTAICGNCSGTGIGWCRCGHESAIRAIHIYPPSRQVGCEQTSGEGCSDERPNDSKRVGAFLFLQQNSLPAR